MENDNRSKTNDNTLHDGRDNVAANAGKTAGIEVVHDQDTAGPEIVEQCSASACPDDGDPDDEGLCTEEYFAAEDVDDEGYADGDIDIDDLYFSDDEDYDEDSGDEIPTHYYSNPDPYFQMPKLPADHPRHDIRIDEDGHIHVKNFFAYKLPELHLVREIGKTTYLISTGYEGTGSLASKWQKHLIDQNEDAVDEMDAADMEQDTDDDPDSDDGNEDFPDGAAPDPFIIRDPDDSGSTPETINGILRPDEDVCLAVTNGGKKC